MTSNPAAQEIGLLVNHILALAPDAGLYVSIKIEPRNDPTRQITHADCAEMAGGFNVFHAQENY